MELSKFIMGRTSLKSKLPEDILSVEEVDWMIEAEARWLLSQRDKEIQGGQ